MKKIDRKQKISCFRKETNVTENFSYQALINLFYKILNLPIDGLRMTAGKPFSTKSDTIVSDKFFVKA